MAPFRLSVRGPGAYRNVTTFITIIYLIGGGHRRYSERRISAVNVEDLTIIPYPRNTLSLCHLSASRLGGVLPGVLITRPSSDP